MNFRSITVGVALAIFGLGAAVGIGLAANSISGDSVGLSAEPLSPGDTLAPPAADDTARARGLGPSAGVQSAVVPRAVARPAASARRHLPRARPRPRRPPPPTSSRPATTTPAAAARTIRAAAAPDDSGSDDSGGGSDDSSGRGSDDSGGDSDD